MEKHLEGFLQSYAAAWKANDSEQIANHWDRAQFLFYKAEEVEHFFHEFSQAQAYWQGNEALHERIVLRFGTPHCHALTHDAFVSIVPMRWDIRFAVEATLPDGSAFPHRGRSMGGSNHVVATFSDGHHGLQLKSWSETPNAAITTLRALYMERADKEVLN